MKIFLMNINVNACTLENSSYIFFSYNVSILIFQTIINKYNNFQQKDIYFKIQPRPQSNLKKIAVVLHDFAGNFYLIWFVNCTTIKANLCNSMQNSCCFKWTLFFICCRSLMMLCGLNNISSFLSFTILYDLLIALCCYSIIICCVLIMLCRFSILLSG